MPEIIGQVLSKAELEKKRDEYRVAAQQLQLDAAANNGAAQAIEQLIMDMEKTVVSELPKT